MSDIAIQGVLREMQRLSADAAGLETVRSEMRETAGAAFADLLSQSLDQVNGLQSEARDMSTAFQRGDVDVNVAEVMIALEKASVAFEAVTQTRNRLLTAYRDVMNMSV